MLKKQPKWNKYEAVLLMDYFLCIENGKKNRQKAILELSELLRNYAINNCIEIDEKYRNQSGIAMKIENIRFIFTNGQKGLKCHSKLEKEIVCLYKENLCSYEKLLSEAKKMYL